MDSPLILPPKDLDLSQVSDPLARAQSNPVEQLKEIVTELSRQQMRAVQEVIDRLDKKIDDKVDALVPAINAELNEMARQLEGAREHNFYLETVLDSVIKLELLGDKMPPETLQQHREVVATFLRNNAVLTVAAEHVETIQ
jgi:hypothetical protein